LAGPNQQDDRDRKALLDRAWNSFSARQKTDGAVWDLDRHPTGLSLERRGLLLNLMEGSEGEIAYGEIQSPNRAGDQRHTFHVRRSAPDGATFLLNREGPFTLDEIAAELVKRFLLLTDAKT